MRTHKLTNVWGVLAQIENAYDLLFMSSMRDRITGDRQVPDRVKFADVEKPRPKQVCVKRILMVPNILLDNSAYVIR